MQRHRYLRIWSISFQEGEAEILLRQKLCMDALKISFYAVCMFLPLGTCIKSSSLGKAAVPPGFWLLSYPGDLLTAHWSPLYTHGFSFPENLSASGPGEHPDLGLSMKMSHSRSTNVDLETWKHPRVMRIHNLMGTRNSAVTPWSCSQTRHKEASSCGELVPFPTGPCERTIAPYCRSHRPPRCRPAPWSAVHLLSRWWGPTPFRQAAIAGNLL